MGVMDAAIELPDGSGFFIAEVPSHYEPRPPQFPGYDEAVMWNPWNKVVQDYRDGTIVDHLTNAQRVLRGLPVPWTPDMGYRECREPGIA
jgi:hypothetical protein